MTATAKRRRRARRVINEDHNPAEYDYCPHGHPMEPFMAPVHNCTGRRGDWEIAYWCETCFQDGQRRGESADEVTCISIPTTPNSQRLRQRH